MLPNALVGSTVKNVMSLSTGLAAGSVPVSIVSLSQGVLRSMLFAKIGLIAAAAVGLGAAATRRRRVRSAQAHRNKPAPERPALNPEPVIAAAPPQKARKKNPPARRN